MLVRMSHRVAMPAMVGVAAKAVNLNSSVLVVKNRVDLDGLFSNEWTNGLLGIRGLVIVMSSQGNSHVLC